MDDFPAYEIRNIVDFMKVPADRLPLCLANFAESMVIARSVYALVDDISSTDLGNLDFTWVDDGKNELTDIKVTCEGETLVAFTRNADGTYTVTEGE